MSMSHRPKKSSIVFTLSSPIIEIKQEAEMSVKESNDLEVKCLTHTD